ncbi:hypothetical protein Btru_059553 [Bulinus truncatus]|nr:hypothetical protein Btru_059553 [Bulinus truncatus]
MATVTVKLTNMATVTVKLTNMATVTVKLTNMATVTVKLTNMVTVTVKLANMVTVTVKLTNMVTVTVKLTNMVTVTVKLTNMVTVTVKLTNMVTVTVKLTNMVTVTVKLTNMVTVTVKLTNMSTVTVKLTNMNPCGQFVDSGQSAGRDGGFITGKVSQLGGVDGVRSAVYIPPTPPPPYDCVAVERQADWVMMCRSNPGPTSIIQANLAVKDVGLTQRDGTDLWETSGPKELNQCPPYFRDQTPPGSHGQLDTGVDRY